MQTRRVETMGKEGTIAEEMPAVETTSSQIHQNIWELVDEEPMGRGG